MFQAYSISFLYSSLNISSWKPCRKVHNVISGVRKIHAFLQPWEVLARLVWDLIFSLLLQTRCLFYSVIQLTSLGPHYFTIAPD